MTIPPDTQRGRRLALPPAFSPVVLPFDSDGAFAHACRIAADMPDGAAPLVWAGPAETFDIAVVLVPEEPLRTARRAFLAGMVALAAAVGAHAPPEMPVEIAWPDTLLFDGARIGGGRLAWPPRCGEDEVPDWLVVSGMLIVSKAYAGDPGLTPTSTSLDEQGFGHDDQESLVEGFARNLMKTFEVWAEDGFDAVGRRYLAHLPAGEGDVRLALTETGDLSDGTIRPLMPALAVPAWLDPATGRVRL
ncbi:biotin/lipoate--protein ligase family protein [Methylobacterium sp. Leaf466]|uniref:biotin/lipoate--protein ligase family protein n=1 Tax=Methylobacterium sp. Leaf466 TaxID=1736386 RepID=UPI0006FA50A6|nr:biotin/lipoate--protein ligase family protein [Methylobacterium sp. Leaf466]KQT90310.1 hypothetical protein ASG59_00415 [Methylobacterium sp. Leaf466]